ncbi:PfkB family carbohydrate kinase [Palaeococcus ferrophilus]|uniref:PfkB family carbohydrate kinase n=1 Tax=Palaeococcus ferrophilus TaxID=83868 RepID=UPI00064FC4DF|nr:PfkB family carbohydrate kinase [Palaeococcus ferrophilus]
MRVLVVGNLTRDVIVSGKGRWERTGGGAYYSALALRGLARVDVVTKGAPEGPLPEGINFHVLPSDEITTYLLEYRGEGRRLSLLSRGGEIRPEELPPLEDYDFVVANPVAGELSPKTLERLMERPLALDVQGLVRRFGEEGEVFMGPLEPDVLDGVWVLHGDVREILTLGSFERVLETLAERVEVALISNGSERGIALHRGKVYAFYPPRRDVENPTGAGDTLLGAFSFFYRTLPFVKALKTAVAFTALSLEGSANLKKAMSMAREVRVERLSNVDPGHHYPKGQSTSSP